MFDVYPGDMFVAKGYHNDVYQVIYVDPSRDDLSMRLIMLQMTTIPGSSPARIDKYTLSVKSLFFDKEYFTLVRAS